MAPEGMEPRFHRRGFTGDQVTEVTLRAPLDHDLYSSGPVLAVNFVTRLAVSRRERRHVGRGDRHVRAASLGWVMELTLG